MDVQILQFEEIKYVTRFPDRYKVGQKYPVVIFLHGAGSRGNNTDLLLKNPYFKIIDKHSDFPFITIAPQCSENTWFDVFEQLKRFVCKIAHEGFEWMLSNTNTNFEMPTDIFKDSSIYG